MKKVTTVIVTYNRLSLLKECIQALLEQRGNFENHLLVINNNSTDGTGEYLDNINLDSVKAINLERNMGGAAGFEYGVRKAYELFDDDYVWIMDDDTIPSMDALERLIESGDKLDNKFGFLCSNVRWTDGTGCNIPKVEAKWTNELSQGLVQVETATFVSVFVQRETIEEVGLPAGDLFIWGDDTEYTKRISSKKRSYLVIDSIVLHKTKNNLSDVSIINDDVGRVSRYFYLYRNLYFISKTYYNRVYSLRMLCKEIVMLFKIATKAKNKKLYRMGIILKAFYKGFMFKPQIRKVR
ncbi:glycosyltransferase family 2 protein [Latilactobacillus sakei]|uniref:glycosyltransferase family 2 protein n=1 Tax=Latilactobacillus sakei TaxID=1599 RepID=UPI003F52D083